MLARMHDKFHLDDDEAATGISQLVLVGLGGVGKSQLATEYCYRHYGSTYGLVMWLRAEQAESLEGDLRRLCTDTGIDVKGLSTEEVSAPERSPRGGGTRDLPRPPGAGAFGRL